MLNFISEGKGIPVIFLHGFMGSLINLKKLSDSLDKNLYKSYLVDLPSHGDSPYLESLNYEKLEGALENFLKEQEIEKAILVGHSMGGKLAMKFALSYPERVLGLFILDIGVFSLSDKYEQLVKAIKTINLDSSLSEIKDFLNNSLEDKTLAGFITLNMQSTPTGFTWKRDVLSLVEENKNIWLGLENNSNAICEKPLTLLRGENSDFVKQKDIDEIKKLFPNATIIILEKVGHFPHLESFSLSEEAFKELIKKASF